MYIITNARIQFLFSLLFLYWCVFQLSWKYILLLSYDISDWKYKMTSRKHLFSYIVFYLQFISQKFWILLCLKQGNVKAANCWYYIKIFLITSVTPHHINQLLLAFTGKHKVVCMVICLKGHSKPAYSLVSIWFYQRFISGQSFRRIMTQSRRCLCATFCNIFFFSSFFVLQLILAVLNHM